MKCDVYEFRDVEGVARYFEMAYEDEISEIEEAENLIRRLGCNHQSAPLRRGYRLREGDGTVSWLVEIGPIRGFTNAQSISAEVDTVDTFVLTDCVEKDLPSSSVSGYSNPVEQRKREDQQSKLLTEAFREASQGVRQQFADNLTDRELVALEEVAKVAKEKPYRELIFGDKRPTIARFGRWLKAMQGENLPNEDKSCYAKAINYFKTRLNTALIFTDEKTGEEHECGIAINKATKSTTRFRLYKTGHQGTELKSMTRFPHLSVRAK